MQFKAVVIPADSDLPVEVKEFDDSKFTNLNDLIGLDHDETLGFPGVGDDKHNFVLDDNGRLKAGPVLNVRAMLLWGMVLHVNPELLSPLVGNIAVIAHDFAGDDCDVTDHMVELIKGIDLIQDTEQEHKS